MQSEWQRSPETKTEIITSKPAKKSKKGNKLKSEYTAKEALGLPEKDDEAPKPWHINVHDGFDDLYNRPVTQPDGGPKLSPRQVGVTLRCFAHGTMCAYKLATACLAM